MLPRKSSRLAKRPAVSYYAKVDITTPSKKKKTVTTTAKKPKKVTKKHAFTPENAGLEAPPAAAPSIADPIDAEAKIVDRSFDVHEAFAHLKKVDSKLAKLITDKDISDFVHRVQGTDPSNPFRDLATSIIYQQISGNVAQAIRTRFVKYFAEPNKVEVPAVVTGNFHWFPTPDMVLAKTPEELKTVGLSLRKAQYIGDLARKFKDNDITAHKLQRMTDDQVRELLIQVKGIGHWTVDMYLMMDLGHPDILATTDLGIRKGVAKHFGLKNNLPSPEDMERLTEKWRVSVPDAFFTDTALIYANKSHIEVLAAG